MNAGVFASIKITWIELDISTELRIMVLPWRSVKIPYNLSEAVSRSL
jgi:hypothetical protein